LAPVEQGQIDVSLNALILDAPSRSCMFRFLIVAQRLWLALKPSGKHIMTEQQRISQLRNLTSQLMDYGWFVPPFIVGEEHERIGKLGAYITANPPLDTAARSAIENKIYVELLDVAFSNEVRARYVWLALRTPHIQEYSHLYESAIFAYYKREYAASVCLLLVMLEGVLLSINGWKVGQQNKPSFNQLINTVTNLQLANVNSEMNAIQVVFREALSDFVRRWLYSNTANADFTLSVLNRHYVLHGMDTGNFYRPQDLHRLLFGFDLLIDLIAIINGTYRSIVDVDANKYEERKDFYSDLRAGAMQTQAVSENEQRFLRQHSNYVAPILEAFAGALSAHLVVPESLEPGRSELGVSDGVLDIPVPQVGLQAAGIDALVRKRKTAGMPQHVRVNQETEASGNTQPGNQLAESGSCERHAPLRGENER
jgi:hypothetical protein